MRTLDQCRFKACWRKRTRLLCGHLDSQDTEALGRMCTGSGGYCGTGKKHWILSGSAGGCDRTSVAAAYPPQLAALHSSGRVGKVLTTTYDSPPPARSKAPVASAAAAPRAQLQPPGAGPAVRPIVSLHLGKRLGRAAGAAVIPRRYVA